MQTPSRLVAPCLVGALLMLAQLPVGAHHCGPQRVTLKVGDTCLWRIVADRTETSTLYAPSLSGSGVVSVNPLKSMFRAVHGDFLFTALAPGTNQFDCFWRYDPPDEEPVTGFCFTTIVVEPADTNQTFSGFAKGGVLTTYSGIGGIEPKELKAMFDKFIPAESQKLLVLGMCFAGDFAVSEQFVNAPNIAVASATSKNQTAKYGGYHDDAANALSPGPGRTAETMHEAGNVGKYSTPPPAVGFTRTKQKLLEVCEWPQATGGLSLDGFSLERVSPSGPVKSRHIVIFMGQPEAKDVYLKDLDGISVPDITGNQVSVDDNADRDAIKNNFAGEPNTTVRTVGGTPADDDFSKGQNGWDLPGDEASLMKAIKEAGDAIRNSPDPAAEQFILFCGDHGQQGIIFEAVESVVSPGTSASAALEWNLDISGSSYMHLDLNNKPYLNIEFVPEPNDPGGSGGGTASLSFAKGDFELELQLETGASLLLRNFTARLFDLDDDGIIGSEPGESVELYFPIDEFELLTRVRGVPTDIVFHNHTAQAVRLQSLSFVSGSVAKPSAPIPTPHIQSVRPVAGNELELIVSGPAGEFFMLEKSHDNLVWQDVRTVRLTSELTTFTEPLNAAEEKTIYRLRWLDL